MVSRAREFGADEGETVAENLPCFREPQQAPVHPGRGAADVEGANSPGAAVGDGGVAPRAAVVVGSPPFDPMRLAVLLADRVVVMSPRPGRIEQVIEIRMPRPRGLEARRHPAFVDAAERITQIFLARGVLHGAASAASGQPS